MRTVSAKKEEVTRQWYVVDAEGQTLGRLSTEIANRLRGKHKASFTPHVDTGDYVVVINAEKVKVTGRKAQDKMYYHHTGFPGGIKSISFEKLADKAPERIIEAAV
uniref:50S ribosomal protein L13 n=1 Tax=Winogradskyella sp. TaxID=1883156 RepID=UPI003511DE6F